MDSLKIVDFEVGVRRLKSFNNPWIVIPEMGCGFMDKEGCQMKYIIGN